jgi:hypothetical protein
MEGNAICAPMIGTVPERLHSLRVGEMIIAVRPLQNSRYTRITHRDLVTSFWNRTVKWGALFGSVLIAFLPRSRIQFHVFAIPVAFLTFIEDVMVNPVGAMSLIFVL